MRRRIFLAAAAASALPLPSIAAATGDTTLRFVPTASLMVLDPVMSSANVTINHGYAVFDTLYAVDNRFAIHPQMAAGHSVSDDGLIWTIVLRDGLRFHDGTPVRAIDCIASLKRWTQRDSFGQVLARSVVEWQAPDDRTVRLRLSQRFPLLLEVLAKPTGPAFIMPERLARTNIAVAVTEMVGSGPFRFVQDEFVGGSRAVYRKFDGYVPRQEASNWASGGKVAGVERIEWQMIPDTSTAAAALESGEVDWWETVPPDLLPVVRAKRDIVTDITDPSGFLAILRFNTLQAPFNNPELRRAVLRSVNQADYLALIGNPDDSNSTRTCHSFFPCGTQYGTASAPDPMAHPLSIEAGRKAIADAGYKGEKIVIINPSDQPSISPLGQMTYDLLKRLGMNVDLAVMDWASVVQRRTNRGPVSEGGWSILHTWNSGTTMANPLQNFTLRGQGSKGWFGWYDSPKVEQLATDWLHAETPADQVRIVAEMQATALADAPTVPLGQFFQQTAYRRNVTGIHPAPIPFLWGVRKT
jgi:peptide/nickel transport system substrate-binding protein